MIELKPSPAPIAAILRNGLICPVHGQYVIGERIYLIGEFHLEPMVWDSTGSPIGSVTITSAHDIVGHIDPATGARRLVQPRLP